MMTYHLHLIIISDRISRRQKTDQTRDHVTRWCNENGYDLIFEGVVADEDHEIRAILRRALERNDSHLIITSGGTGFSPRDITPESTRPLLEKLTPGIDELLRHAGIKETPYAVLSRGVSGITKNKLVINLPGNPKAVISNLDVLKPVLPHALRSLNERIEDTEHQFSESKK
jgi:molybdenum cofactor synthesis domain-containing protein